MIKLTGTISYKLEIDPSGDKHTLEADNSIESDIVAIMMCCNALTVQLGQWKETKKTLHGPDKKKASEQISMLGTALRAAKPLMHQLLNSYEAFKKHQGQPTPTENVEFDEEYAAKKAEFLTEQGVLPKEGE